MKDLSNGLKTAFADTRRHPELARVLAVHAGITHTADLEIISAGNGTATGEFFTEVPLSPIWAGSNGNGIYAPPAKDTQVILAFIQGNPAYPYIAQPYNRDYNCAQHAPDALTITDGNATITLTPDSLFAINNQAASLAELMEDFIDILMQLQTQGGPTNQLIAAITITKLLKLKSDFKLLLKKGTT